MPEKTEQTFITPGMTVRSVSRCVLILALLLLSTSLWFFKASVLLSLDNPFLSNFTGASTSSPLSLSKTREKDEPHPLPITALLPSKPSLFPLGTSPDFSFSTRFHVMCPNSSRPNFFPNSLSNHDPKIFTHIINT